MLNPGVYVTEINASTIAPVVSNSIAVFAGDFVKGPVGESTIITSVGDLINFYGKPTNNNYNDFYQAYNFLHYGNKLLISRASNIGGTGTPISGETVSTAITASTATTPDVSVTNGASFNIGDIIAFDTTTGSPDLANQYIVKAITANVITLNTIPVADISMGSSIYSVIRSMNGVAEAISVGGTPPTADQMFADLMVISNPSEYANVETSIPFSSTTAKLKLIARNPGAWASNLEIAIATPAAFGAATPSEAFTGVALDALFEYAPTGSEVGIIIRENGTIVETWTVSFDPTAKDHNNKSTYVETVINNMSSYIYAKDNTANTAVIEDSCATVNGVVGSTITMAYASDSAIQADDLLNAYDIFSNKETLDVDIVIANELDGGVSAKALVDARQDCIGFIGANYSDVVGQKSAVATANLVSWRKTGLINYENMFLVAAGNYAYQYDRYNDRYRWINIAGHIAGLRAETSTKRASWWASAGLERGQLKGITKLAFNPTAGQRDMLYKNGVNPVVSFSGQGVVMWGQKTLLSKPSSFDRVNTRGLFNTLERSLSRMAKYQVMEFNDNFTRNRIVSMIKPYLSGVQAGRGIQDFLVICDTSNNTPDVIAKNQLVVDIYIKPTYVAEFINLRFTNAGTNSFATVIGG